MALATGIGDKCVAIAYERRKPAHKVDGDWIARCRGQIDPALTALESECRTRPEDGPLRQPAITIAAMLGYLRLRAAEAMPAGKYPTLERLSGLAEATDAFTACRPTIEEIGGAPEAAKAALFRLLGSSQSR
jgi:hypothetical protein